MYSLVETELLRNENSTLLSSVPMRLRMSTSKSYHNELWKNIQKAVSLGQLERPVSPYVQRKLRKDYFINIQKLA